MKPLPGCLPCILHQTLQVARSVSDDEWSQRKVLNEVLRALPDAEWHQSSPAELLADAIASARGTLKVRAPYADLRAQVGEVFAGLAEDLRARAGQEADPFAFLVTAAAAANLVDELVFARFARKDPTQVFEQALAQGFAVGSVDVLRETVERAQTVVYFLDNAGEAQIDALLVEHLRGLGKTVFVAVRGGGLLHDATPEDALAAGLAPPSTADPAPASPGDAERGSPNDGAPVFSEPGAEQTPESASDDPAPRALPWLIELPFGELGVSAVARSTDLGAALERADLVLAKGSANYETLRADRECFFLLRAKCGPVAASLAVPQGSLVLHHVKAPEARASEPASV